MCITVKLSIKPKKPENKKIGSEVIIWNRILSFIQEK